MPSPSEVLKDPNFTGLPFEERRKVMIKLDPNFSGLARGEQDKVLGLSSGKVKPETYRSPEAQMGMGALKGAGETLMTMGKAGDIAMGGPLIRKMLPARVGKQEAEFESGIKKKLETKTPGESIGKAVEGVAEASIPGGAVKGARALLPSAERAGQTLEAVTKAAGHLPIDISGPMDAAIRINKLARSGSAMPKVVSDFFKRIAFNNKNAMEMSFKDARDFYTNATRLSASESMSLTAPVKRLVGQFTEELGKTLQRTATKAGEGDRYRKAIGEYRKAMRLRRAGESAKEAATGKLAKAAMGGGAAGAGYSVIRKIMEDK